MSPAAYLTLGVLTAAVLAFAVGRWRPDAVALLGLLILLLSRILDPRTAFAGFGSPVLITLGAVYVVSAALERTGVASTLGQRIFRLAGGSEVRLILAFGTAAGLLSGVMNSIGAMAVLLPAAMATAREARISPSKLLLPLALGTRLGGNLTLIAGPSNLIASTQLENAGLHPFGFFEFLPVGGSFLIVGLAFIAMIGRRWLPAVTPADERERSRLLDIYRLRERLFEVRVPAASPLVGKTLAESALGATLGLTVLSIRRGLGRIAAPAPAEQLSAGDRLLVQGRQEGFTALPFASSVQVREQEAVDLGALESADVRVVEVVLAPRSSIAGKTMRDVDFREKYGLTVLAIWREGRPRRTALVDVPVQFGDALLLQGHRDRIRLLARDQDFLVLTRDEAGPRRPDRAGWALLALLLMIVLSTAGIEIAVAALLAAVVVVGAGCLTVEEIYQAVDWRSLVFIGAMLPLSTALAVTGAADHAVGGALALIGRSPWLALGALLLIGIVANQVMPSVAATVLLVPMAIQLAVATGSSAHAFVMAVIAATGTTFTPISSPVNLLVMGPGGYRMSDYVRVGLPLALLLGAAGLAVIPIAWPLR